MVIVFGLLALVALVIAALANRENAPPLSFAVFALAVIELIRAALAFHP